MSSYNFSSNGSLLSFKLCKANHGAMSLSKWPTNKYIQCHDGSDSKADQLFFSMWFT